MSESEWTTRLGFIETHEPDGWEIMFTKNGRPANHFGMDIHAGDQLVLVGDTIEVSDVQVDPSQQEVTMWVDCDSIEMLFGGGMGSGAPGDGWVTGCNWMLGMGWEVCNPDGLPPLVRDILG